MCLSRLYLLHKYLWSSTPCQAVCWLKGNKSEQNNKNLCPHGAYIVVRGVLRVEYSLPGMLSDTQNALRYFLSN